MRRAAHIATGSESAPRGHRGPARERPLDLITFFTAGEQDTRALDRCATAQNRAWTLRAAIHTRYRTRGFIRCEVINWQDLVTSRLGGRRPAKQAKQGLEGKTYVGQGRGRPETFASPRRLATLSASRTDLRLDLLRRRDESTSLGGGELCLERLLLDRGDELVELARVPRRGSCPAERGDQPRRGCRGRSLLNGVLEQRDFRRPHRLERSRELGGRGSWPVRSWAPGPAQAACDGT